MSNRILYSDSPLVQKGALSRAYLQVASNPFTSAEGISDIIQQLHAEYEASKLLHERTMATLKAEFESKSIDLELENKQHL